LSSIAVFQGSGFTDFPLGNPCDHPWQPEMQREIVRQALSLFGTAKAPRTTVKAPFSWKEDGVVWRARYGRVDPTDKESLLKLGEAIGSSLGKLVGGEQLLFLFAIAMIAVGVAMLRPRAAAGDPDVRIKMS
jgi:hypothetical protein